MFNKNKGIKGMKKKKVKIVENPYKKSYNPAKQI